MIMHAMTAAVLGANGYAGVELTRILARHPRLKLAGLFSDPWAGQIAGDRVPLPESSARLRYRPFSELAELDAEVVFLGLPNELSLRLTPELLSRGMRVVDLSGAFRLEDPELYPRWYGFRHTAPELIRTARYGLPELARGELTGTRLVANAGCYATAIAMALAPLVRSGHVSPDGISVCAMSGFSGAGRKALEEYSFCEADEDLRAYRLAKHQHVPEIEQTVRRYAGRCGPISFTPHLVPLRRGILATCSLRVERGASADDLAAAFETAYRAEPFVRIMSPDQVRIGDVARTNRVHVGVGFDARTGLAIAVSAIDNLIKGAAGEAIQSFNASMGWDEALGLDLAGG